MAAGSGPVSVARTAHRSRCAAHADGHAGDKPVSPGRSRLGYGRVCLASFGLGLGVAGCVDTGATEVNAELRVVGATDLVVNARNGWQVMLDEALVVFGPLWLCAGTTAGELCETARAEWLDATVVDALDDAEQRVGQLVGSEGEVRSWMYDYGLVSRLTEVDPWITPAAKTLNGNSVRLAGCATLEAKQLCFNLELPIAQGAAAEQGVPVVRVSGSKRVLATFGKVQQLTAGFNAAEWISTIDFDSLYFENGCDVGCEVISITAENQAARAVRSALEGTARPTLDWAEEH